MADVTVDNGALADYVVDAVELADASHVGTVHLVTAVEGGAKTDLAKAEDAPAATGDMGLQVLGVRNDAAAARTSLDGDYGAFALDSAGRVGVTALGGSIPVTDNGGSLTVDGSVAVTGAVDTELTTADLDTGAGTDTRAVVGLALAASGGALLAGAANPVPVSDNGGSLTVDGTVTTSPSGDHTVVGKAADGAAVAGNPVLVAGQDGTNVQSIKTDAAGELQVDVLTLPALAAGANAIGTVGVTSMPTGASAAQAQGDVAHDGVDSGNPVKVGARAVAHGANPTAVAAGDRTDLFANRHGVQFVIGGHPNTVTVEAAYTAAQTDVAIVTVAGGLKIVVTSILVDLDEATTVGVGFRVGFGAVNTPTTTGVVASHPGMVPGGGLTRGDGTGILGIGADGEDLRITAEVPTSGSLRVIVGYYTVES